MRVADPDMLRHAAWIARALGRGDLFPFSDDEVRELAASIGVERLPAGTRILGVGEEVGFIGIIESGEVEVFHRRGARRVMLQVLRAGDMIGDVPYFCRMTSPFSARALSEVVLLRLDDARIKNLLHTRPMIAERFLYSLASRLERMQRRLLQLTGRSLRAQVARLLIDEIDGDRGRLDLPQSMIAELLGAARPSVNRVLKDLESEGIVRLTYRRVEVRNLEQLIVEARA
ncbi:MAG: Crp/Fnr family transcriptional regulator [Actinobacteria bacterium]|nr:Crp/Fnr family transcriptional regulator [Actinomycetota bacterium]